MESEAFGEVGIVEWVFAQAECAVYVDHQLVLRRLYKAAHGLVVVAAELMAVADSAVGDMGEVAGCDEVHVVEAVVPGLYHHGVVVVYDEFSGESGGYHGCEV